MSRKRAQLAAKADPVFAAIDLMKAAMAENDRRAKDEKAGKDLAALLSHARLCRAGDRWSAAFKMLIATVPTTAEGLQALIEFVVDDFLAKWLGGTDELTQQEAVCLLKTVRTFSMELQCAR